MIKNAHTSIIQKILILIDIKKDKSIKNKKLYKSTFIHLDFEISLLIITPWNLFEYKINNKIIIINNIDNIIKSTLLINKILQNKKLFISRLKFHINHIVNIQRAKPEIEIISLLDSLVIKLVFSMKNNKILAIIEKIKA